MLTKILDCSKLKVQSKISVKIGPYCNNIYLFIFYIIV